MLVNNCVVEPLPCLSELNTNAASQNQSIAEIQTMLIRRQKKYVWANWQ